MGFSRGKLSQDNGLFIFGLCSEGWGQIDGKRESKMSLKKVQVTNWLSEAMTDKKHPRGFIRAQWVPQTVQKESFQKNYHIVKMMDACRAVKKTRGCPGLLGSWWLPTAAITAASLHTKHKINCLSCKMNIRQEISSLAQLSRNIHTTFFFFCRWESV